MVEQTEKKQAKKKVEEVKVVEAPKTEEVKTEAKKAEVKQVPKSVKDVAVANGFSMKISTKHSISIGKMIRGKSPERAIEMLEKVLLHKMAVPMRGMEIPHRKRGLIPHSTGGSGRFPANASKEFINLLQQLKANCVVNGIDNPVITISMSNLASRPFKREGKRAKRTHVHLEARDKTKLLQKKK